MGGPQHLTGDFDRSSLVLPQQMDLCLVTGKVAGRPRLILRPRMEELVQGLPLRPPLPSQARAAQAFGSGHRGEPPPPRPSAQEHLCCRTETKPWSTVVVVKRTVLERKLCALYNSLSSPAFPPQRVEPPPGPLARPRHPLLPRTSHSVGDTPVSPSFRAVLRRLCWARRLTFLWMAAPPPPGPSS